MTRRPGDGQVRAHALDCRDTCSRLVTVNNGEQAALRDDPAHLFTRGSRCEDSGPVYHDNRARVDQICQEAI
jgi:hypothetical protein